MDLDGDGMLSMYELEYFYEEQCERMESMGIEPLPFHDLLCQMLDLVKPECEGKAHLYNNIHLHCWPFLGSMIIFDLSDIFDLPDPFEELSYSVCITSLAVTSRTLDPSRW